MKRSNIRTFEPSRPSTRANPDPVLFSRSIIDTDASATYASLMKFTREEDIPQEIKSEVTEAVELPDLRLPTGDVSDQRAASANTSASEANTAAEDKNEEGVSSDVDQIMATFDPALEPGHAEKSASEVTPPTGNTNLGRQANPLEPEVTINTGPEIPWQGQRVLGMIAMADQTNQTLRSRLTGRQRTLTSIQNRITKVQEQIASRSQELEKLQETSARLRDSIDITGMESTRDFTAILKANGKEAHLHQCIAGAEREIYELEQKYRDRSAVIGKIKESNRSCQREINMLSGQRAQLEQDRARWEKNVTFIKERINQEIWRYDRLGSVGRKFFELSTLYFNLIEENNELLRQLPPGANIKFDFTRLPLSKPPPFPACRLHPQYQGQPSGIRKPKCPQEQCQPILAQQTRPLDHYLLANLQPSLNVQPLPTILTSNFVKIAPQPTPAATVVSGETGSVSDVRSLSLTESEEGIRRTPSSVNLFDENMSVSGSSQSPMDPRLQAAAQERPPRHQGADDQ